MAQTSSQLEGREDELEGDPPFLCSSSVRKVNVNRGLINPWLITPGGGVPF